MAAGALDSNGIWIYGEDDPLSPFSDLLNLLANSVSAKVGSRPNGMLPSGYAEINANTTVNATGTIAASPTDIPGLAVAVNVPAGRRIKITFDGMIFSSVAGDQCAVGVREGSSLLVYVQTVGVTTASRAYQAHCEVILTPTAGAHTYKISIGRVTGGTGNVNLAGANNAKSFIVVEDIGAV